MSQYKRMLVGFAGEAVAEAYCDPNEQWNGFLRPLMDRANALKYCEWCRRQAATGVDGVCVPFFWGDKLVTYQDVYIGVKPEADFSPSIAEPTTITTDGYPVTVWRVGEGCTWEEVEAKPPRFVLNVGAVREQYPDLPETPDNGDVILWDRQEHKPVFTLHGAYSQAICLELIGESGPSAIEDWFNGLSNESLESEGLPITK